MELWPVEPPLAGPADQQIVAALDRLRATFRWKADGLDGAGLQTRVGRSSLTLGGPLKHLSAVESLNLSWEAFHEEPDELEDGHTTNPMTDGDRLTGDRSGPG